MNSQDAARVGHKARRETEAFINNHINDQAKGWPIISHRGSVYTEYRKEKNVKRRDI